MGTTYTERTGMLTILSVLLWTYTPKYIRPKQNNLKIKPMHEDISYIFYSST